MMFVRGLLTLALQTRVLGIVLLTSGLGWAQDLPSYDIQRTPEKIAIDGKLDEAVWQKAKPVSDFHFNWWTSGEKEKTVAKMLWDDTNLYVGYYCYDKHISAKVTQRNGPVSRDDCVELFVSPNPAKVRNYYGFELNAIGTMLSFIHSDWWRGGRFSEPVGIRRCTSYDGRSLKVDSPDDDHWILEIAVPFENFAKDAAHTPPRNGDRWRLNLNRAGGTTNAQYSTWSPINTPAPSFGNPNAFGWVTFVGDAP